MEVITREITLNVDRFVRTRQTVRFAGKVGDHNARRIVAHILNGAAPLALDGTETVLLHCARREPQTLETESETFLASVREDGRVEVTLPVWVFTYPGMVDCEFAISTSSQTVRTEDFLIQSLEAVRQDAEPAQDEDVDILAELIAEAREVLGEIEEQGVSFEIDGTLKYDAQHRLGVNTTNEAAQDNTLPITAAGVYTQIGNINALLATI